MNKLRVILSKIYDSYWKLITKRKKELFAKGEILEYRYKNEIFCNGKDAFKSVVNKYKNKQLDSFWNNKKEYSLSDYFPQRYNKVGIMIFDRFLPLYKDKKPVLMDIGCATGEWTLRVANECKEIDGYEMSKELVETAKKMGQNIPNAHFYQANAKTMKFDKVYDGALIQGMLMYIDDLEVIYQILKNVYDHLKPGAYLCTRDTLNKEGKDVVFLYNFKTGYNGVYWSQSLYYKQYEKAGFKLVKQYLLDDVKTRRLHFIGRGAIWQKPE